MTSFESSVRLRDRSLTRTPDHKKMSPGPSSVGPPRTPKSAGDRTRMLRRELFSPSSPGWKSSIGSPFTAVKSPRKSRPVPDHFKMQMPTSARKKPVEPGPPSARFSPIVKSAFYGPSSPAAPKRKNQDESMTSVNSSLSEDLDSSVASNKSEGRQPLKPKNSKEDPLRSKKSVQSGRVSKTKPKKKSVLGGKGVSHAIKKPSKKLIQKKMKQREERLKRERVARMKEVRKEASRSIIKSATSEFGKSFFEDLVDDDKASNKKARRSKGGKISIPRPNANVSYEIKNGQPVFSLRRSPRKSQPSYLSPETPPVISWSTPKLFSPNGSDDYLPGTQSPARKRPRTIPSPIKFDSSSATSGGSASQNDEEDATINDSVKNIISTLDEADDNNEQEADANVSQDEYAVYVTDDEMAMAVALDAANAATADAGSVPEDANQPEDTHATIQDILSNLAPITEAEVNEKRGTGNPRVTRGTPKKGTPKKNFPVFEGRLTRSRSTPTKPSATGGGKAAGPACSTVDADKDGKKQMVIDAGQKVIGAQYCMTCDFVYTSGDVDEEKMHDAKHNQVVGLVKFPGWRSENKIESHDGRIVIVSPSDPKRHWDKVNSVLTVVDTLLGTAGGGQPGEDEAKVRNPQQTKAFMFVTEGRVVGLVTAEVVNQSSDRVSLSVLKDKDTGLRVLDDDVPEAAKAKVAVGVAKVWVSQEFQRRGIATRLVDAMRTHFLPIKALAKDEFAFSHTTPNGSDFATSYLNQTDFMTYAPSLPGQSSLQ